MISVSRFIVQSSSCLQYYPQRTSISFKERLLLIGRDDLGSIEYPLSVGTASAAHDDLDLAVLISRGLAES
jgi:hypothetical protein